MDITEVALSRVTDEFIAHIKAIGDEWDLEQTTEFLVVAATLLDLKIVRLLPSASVEDEDDLALLEARDLLFARLCSTARSSRWPPSSRRRAGRGSSRARAASGSRSASRAVARGLDRPRHREFAALAARALQPRAEPQIGLAHLHAPMVSVREQAALVVDRLRRQRTMTFRALAADSPDLLTNVARFLALLELFREGVVAFEQAAALGELHVRWTGDDEGDIEVGEEYDEPAPTSRSPPGDRCRRAVSQRSGRQRHRSRSEHPDRSHEGPA